MDVEKISVIGIGYVGLFVALNFGKKYSVVGYDISDARIQELTRSFDRNREVTNQEFLNSKIKFTNNPQELQDANFHIITVPTPLGSYQQPNLNFVKAATKTLAKYLKKGDVVVYESTVYPGATEEVFIPTLEKYSKLKSGVDFYIGYSPERINPGDAKNSYLNTNKVVAGQNQKALQIITQVYQSIIQAKVYPASSIKVAESCKLVENVQRDINIAIVNEFALIFDRLGIKTSEVLTAARTKWNFLPFEPGMVGGHCIGVNSYYLAYKAEFAGHYPQLLWASRSVNESICPFIVNKIIYQLAAANKEIENCRVGILGVSYKENTSYATDIPAADLRLLFMANGAQVLLCDPLLDQAFVKQNYDLDIHSIEQLEQLDVLIITIAHTVFKNLPAKNILAMMNENAIIADLKGILDPDKFKQKNINLWSL